METKSYTSVPAGAGLPSVAADGDDGETQLPLVDSEHYIIGDEIARGGMGRVLAAHDRRLGRDVAIKELLPHSAHNLQRFEREAQITARLQHPAIIHVYEAGRWADGKPFYAMNRVAGRSLDKVIAATTALADRLALLPRVITAVDALAYAHAHHVIHRDLKPSNVLVGDYGETVVIDWGLAKQYAADGSASDDAADPLPAPPGYTAFGSVVGTPGYMPPEQARGEPLDPRADVYSLGALLYEVMAGAPPYARGSSRDVVERVLAGPPPPIRTREPDVPLDLAAIIDKAMAREPGDRYADAEQLVADLKRFETGQLVAARHYSTGQHIMRFVRRHALVVGFACVLAVLGAVSVVRITASRNDAEAARAVATARNDALVLLQARAELTRDPTSSLAWLKRYPTTAPGWDEARQLAFDAWSRGIAHDVWDFGTAIGSIAFSPDSKTLAVGALDGTITFIDLDSGQRKTARAPDGAGSRIVFSPDGSLVATSDGHDAVRVWDRASGQSRRLAGDHIGGPSIQFSPDGSLLMVRHLGGDYRTRLWHMPDGEPVALPSGDHGLLAFVPHARTVATADGAAVSLVDLDSGKTLAQTELDHEPAELAVAGDASWIAAARADKLALWNPTTNEVRSVATGKNVVTLLDASADGAHVVSCGMQERDLWLFDVANATGRRLSTDERCARQASGYSPDGKLYMSGALGGELRLHLLPDGQTRLLLGHQEVITDAAFSADGRYIASASSDHMVRLWKWTEGDVRVLYGTTSPDRAAATGRMLVDEPNHQLSTLDIRTGKREPVRDMPERVYDTSLSRDGRVATLLLEDHTVTRLELDTGARRTLPFPELWVTPGIAPSAASGNGDRVAQIDPRGVVRMLDFATGETRELARLGDSSFAVAFSDDGNQLAFGSRDGTLHVVDVNTGAERVSLQVQGNVWMLSFSADGARVGAACGDSIVRVIDIATGKVHELAGHVGSAGGVDLNADGSEIVSSGVDGTVRLWKLDSGIGLIVHREPFPVTAVQFIPGTSLVLERGHDARAYRLWDTRVLPPLTADRETLARWIAGATTAVVDENGALATP